MFYAKNYIAVHLKLDDVNANGDISNYYLDYLVKLSDDRIVVVEAKGREDIDVPIIMQRLNRRCEDINKLQTGISCDFVFVNQESFEKYIPHSFQSLLKGFREYKYEI